VASRRSIFSAARNGECAAHVNPHGRLRHVGPLRSPGPLPGSPPLFARSSPA
jgi:hypothetical protein